MIKRRMWIHLPVRGMRGMRGGPKISEKPEDQQDDDQEFEQVTSLGVPSSLAPRSGERVSRSDG